MSACAPSSIGIFLAFALASVAKSAPISDSELKNLLAAIRQNRTTQADFQEATSDSADEKSGRELGYSLVPAA